MPLPAFLCLLFWLLYSVIFLVAAVFPIVFPVIKQLPLSVVKCTCSRLQASGLWLHVANCTRNGFGAAFSSRSTKTVARPQSTGRQQFNFIMLMFLMHQSEMSCLPLLRVYISCELLFDLKIKLNDFQDNICQSTFRLRAAQILYKYVI